MKRLHSSVLCAKYIHVAATSSESMLFSILSLSTDIKNVIIAVISRCKFYMKINRFFLTGMEAKISGDDQVFIYVNGRFIGVDNGKWKIPTRYSWRLLCVYVSY